MPLMPMVGPDPYDYPGHSGIDFLRGPEWYGKPFYASGEGVVDNLTKSPKGGYIIWIKYDGIQYGIGYCHMDSWAQCPAKGTRVHLGTKLGLVGRTGANVTGPHVHVENSANPTAAGIWAIFDRNRWVGQGGGAGGAIGASQRRIVAAGAKVRAEATSASTELDYLTGGTVADFNGWVRGQIVEGNNVWFRGAHSGGFVWSGGCEGGSNVNGLADLNAPVVGVNQRKAGASGAKSRLLPTTASAEQPNGLAAGTVGDFNGWMRGEAVEGNNVWFRGLHSGNWFWSGGFEGGANVAGLEDLNPAVPPETPSKVRVTKYDMNGRSGPGSVHGIIASRPKDTSIELEGYNTGEMIDMAGVKSDVWFVDEGAWFSAAGFTSQSIEGLPLIPKPSTPTPPVYPRNPRNLPEITPSDPVSSYGLIAPLGDGKRGSKGTPAVTVPLIIDTAMLHWTGVLPDQLDYFSYKNDRSSCPTWYTRLTGEQIQLIRPGMKPASTGSEWNWRSVAWELQMSPNGIGTQAQFEAVAENLAFMKSMDGKEWDGVPVSFELDRAHFKMDRETRSTTCPGDWWASQMDSLLARARVIFDEKYKPVDPEPERKLVLVSDLQKWSDQLALVGSGIESYDIR